MQIEKCKLSTRNTNKRGLVSGLLKFAFCILHSLFGCGIAALGKPLIKTTPWSTDWGRPHDLIEETLQNKLPQHNLNAADRVVLYPEAAGTGFRASALRSLTPDSFDLNSSPPTVTVEAAHRKRRRSDVQPIRKDLPDLFRPRLFNRPNDEKPFGDLPRTSARMLRSDLSAARRKWIA